MTDAATPAQGEPKTTAVRDGHTIDTARLETWLVEHAAGVTPPIELRQFAAGQSNPTYLIKAANGQFVMRKKPPGDLLPSAHMIEREHRIMEALGPTGVPVPAMRVFCDDPEVIGTPFFIMNHVAGRVFQDPALPGMIPAERRATFRDIAHTLARLHSVDWMAAGLGDFGKHSGYVERQVRLWTRQYDAAKTDPIADMDALIEWLPSNQPEDDHTTIAHGDYRPGNLILHPSEPRVVAVLDWELSTLGHPLCDLAYNCLPYYMPEEAGALSGLGGHDLKALGIPEEDEFIADYCAASGRNRPANWNFFVAFSFFRLASISQGVYARAINGNASAPDAMDYGARARRLAQLGWIEAQKGPI